uniref:Uncharacterized protein AlNc14C38G3289 n=1 Tax=Albugo laibachii Nc14 TaxID=890382 RepID=F0W919_9STRA|nr:conserved hypothetical protein [Albugo laibachii Nc14]|eukprot:CCA17630.1 conserved hypothetical protein [Albugo laibachii Nc14]
MLFQLLVLAFTLHECSGACAMTQRCVNPNNTPDYDDCIPEAYAIPVDAKPMHGIGWANVTGGGNCTLASDCHDRGHCIRGQCVCEDDGMTAGERCNQYSIQCPEYKNAACCSWEQNQGLAENFKLLSNVFGKNAAGGCDACASNLMMLWCGLICSPYQSEFMKMHSVYPSVNYRPDPMTGVNHVKLLEMDVSLQKDLTCSVFDSCKNTAIVSMAAAMKSSLGFLNYQAQTGAIAHGEYLFLHFNETSPQAFDHSVLTCSNYSIVENDTFRQSLPQQAQRLDSIISKNAKKQCPCGSCQATCSAHNANSTRPIMITSNPISIWDGFDYRLVGTVNDYGL